MGRKRKSFDDSDDEGKLTWTSDDVFALVARVKEHWDEFSGGMRKKKFIWLDIANELSHADFQVTGLECDRKWRNLKIRYLAVLEKQIAGEKMAHRIEYFDAIHTFLKDDDDTLAYLDQRRRNSLDAKGNIRQKIEDLGHSFEDVIGENDEAMEWTEKSIELLLDVLLVFRDWFTGKEPLEQDDGTIWEAVSEQMKLEGHTPGPEQCRMQWCALVAQYHSHQLEAEAAGSVPLWPYFTRVRRLVNIGIPDSGNIPSNPAKRRVKKSRGRAKKLQRIVKQEVEDPDYVPEGSDDNNPFESGLPVTTTFTTRVDDTVTSSELREVCERLERVEESLSISRRLETLESKMDDLNQQQQAHQQTNNLLRQVLTELTQLTQTLSTRLPTSQAQVDDPTDLSSGITIVVPHSQHLP